MPQRALKKSLESTKTASAGLNLSSSESEFKLSETRAYFESESQKGTDFILNQPEVPSVKP